MLKLYRQGLLYLRSAELVACPSGNAKAGEAALYGTWVIAARKEHPGEVESKPHQYSSMAKRGTYSQDASPALL